MSRLQVEGLRRRTLPLRAVDTLEGESVHAFVDKSSEGIDSKG